MFSLQHDLDAILIATLGVISILWLGRNIYRAIRDLAKESDHPYNGHTAG